MPQKKNPDIAELTRGKSGRIFGNLINLLMILKGLPLAYNKDLQEDKEAIFDSIDNIKLILPVFNKMIQTCTVNKKMMYQSAKSGFLNATDLADYLVKKGIPFRKAHEIVGNLVKLALDEQKELEQLPLETMQAIEPLIQEDVFEKLDINQCVSERNVLGGPSKIQNAQRITQLSKQLKKLKANLKIQMQKFCL